MLLVLTLKAFAPYASLTVPLLGVLAAATIIFGLIFSTTTAVTVVPALYGLLFDRRPGAVKEAAA